MQYLLIMMLFSSILSADDEIKSEEMSLIPVEETEYVMLRGDTIPVPIAEPVVVFPIEDFVRVEGEAK